MFDQKETEKNTNEPRQIHQTFVSVFNVPKKMNFLTHDDGTTCHHFNLSTKEDNVDCRLYGEHEYFSRKKQPVMIVEITPYSKTMPDGKCCIHFDLQLTGRIAQYTRKIYLSKEYLPNNIPESSIIIPCKHGAIIFNRIHG